MQFVLTAFDREGALPVRAATRPTHLDYLATLGASLVLAGPMLNGDGQPIGSILVYEAADQAEAERIAAEDPYAKAGLFARAEVRPFRVVIKDGTPV